MHQRGFRNVRSCFRATATRSLELFLGKVSASLKGVLRALLFSLLVAGSVEAASPKGYHDSSTCTTTTGWTCDPDNYARQLTVHIFRDGPYNGGGSLMGFPTANQSRESAVGTQCGGYQAHGFTYATPTALKDGRAHALYAYAVDTETGNYALLSTSPKTITCLPLKSTLSIGKSSSGPWGSTASFTTSERIYFRITGAEAGQLVYLRWTNSTGTTWYGGTSGTTLTNPATSQAYRTDSTGAVTVGPFPDANGIPGTWVIGTNYQVEVLVAGVVSNRLTYTYAPPSRPTSLSPTSGTTFPNTTKSVTLSWGAVSGAASYAVRANDNMDATLRDARNNCGAVPHYLCVNNLTTTSISVPVRAGHGYTWWVHAVNAAGVSDYVMTNFSVQVPAAVNMSALATGATSYPRFNPTDSRVTPTGTWNLRIYGTMGFDLQGLESTTGGTLSFDVAGNIIHLNVHTGPDYGQLGYKIGTATEKILDLYSAQEQKGVMKELGTALGTGLRKVILRAIPVAGRPRVVINRIAAFNTLDEAKCLDRGIPVNQFCTDLYGNPQFIRSSLEGLPINHDWGTTGPPELGGSIPGIFFMVWAGDFDFAGEKYLFTATSDDGMWVIQDDRNGKMDFIVDAFRDEAQPAMFAGKRQLSGRQRVLVAFYAREGGTAVAKVNWQPWKEEIAGGYRIRTDNYVNGVPECAFPNLLTGNCSCQPGFTAKPYGIARGSGVMNFGPPGPQPYPEILQEVANRIYASGGGLETVGTFVGLPAPVLEYVPYAGYVAAAIHIGIAVYNYVQGPPAPGSPGLMSLCVRDQPINVSDTFQGAYSIRRGDGVSLQPNVMTTQNASCPSGTVGDDVAHTLTDSQNPVYEIACRSATPRLTGPDRSAYGGMFHTRTNGECVQGNALVNVAQYPVTQGWLIPDTTGALLPRFVSFLDNPQDDVLSPTQQLCACPGGYLPLPVGNVSGWGGSPGTVWLCTLPPDVPVTRPAPSPTTGILRARSYDKNTLLGVNATILLARLEADYSLSYSATKEAGPIDSHAVAFSNLRPGFYILYPIRPPGYRKIYYSVCHNTFDGSCPASNSFKEVYIFDGGIHDGLPYGESGIEVKAGETTDIYLSYQP